ncbi:hypothetical protein M885DRAFT_564934 [Pelagophyceae sp. CCMP2097]|nr:hypothetical protein M885DRAFT_564934 [Pelagophyceae sp. CCMP2097]
MVSPAFLRALALLVSGARAEVFTKCAVRRAATHFLVNGTVDRLANADAVCATGATLTAQLNDMVSMAYAPYGAVHYFPTDSADGKESVLEGVVDFAGSESILRDSDVAASPYMRQYPAAAAAIVPVVHLPLLDAAGARLVVDRETLPAIFMGDIFEWTDPRLLALQGDETRAILLQMPDATIRVVVRDDASGSTEIFSAWPIEDARVGGNDVLDWCEDGMELLECVGETYTNGVCDSNPDKVNCFGSKGECEGVSWLRGSGFKSSGTVTCAKAAHGGRRWSYTRGAGTVGVIAAVQSLEGSIGYSVLADVSGDGLRQALFLNKAGEVV